MTTSILAFNESIQFASRWATRTATVSYTAVPGTTTPSLPVTNIFTPNLNQVWEATAIGDGGLGPNPVLLDVRLTPATTPPPLLTNVGGVLGLLNVTGRRDSTGEYISLQVRVAISSTAFTGPYQYDRTHTINMREIQGIGPPQTWFPLTTSIQDPDFQRLGGTIGPGGFVRIEITPLDNGTNWTLRVGRLVRMTTLVCRIDPQPTRAGLDRAEVVRSFSGVPYPLQVARSRRYSGRIVGLTDRQVNGVFLAEDSINRFVPSINLISQLAGRSGEVCVIERANLPASSSRWQTQPVFGILENDLVVSRDSSVNDLDGLSSVAFDVVETPQAIL